MVKAIFSILTVHWFLLKLIKNSRFNPRALKALRDKGIKIFIATGRPQMFNKQSE